MHLFFFFPLNSTPVLLASLLAPPGHQLDVATLIKQKIIVFPPKMWICKKLAINT